MPPQHQSISILKELEQHNAFFDDLVDMIPAKLYVAGNSGDGMYNPKYRKGQHKESKEARRARNKIAKKNKFDPNASETTREEKIRFENEQYDDDDVDDDDNDYHIEDEHEEENENDDDNDEMIDSPTTSTKSSKEGAISDLNENNSTPNTPPIITDSPHNSRIEALRAKLRAKLEEKRSQRPGGGGIGDTMVSKRAARRAEKKRRVELAIKKKQQQQQQGGVSTGSTQTGKHKNGKISLVKQDLGGSQINERNHGDKSVVDDLLCIDFGKIAGLKNDLSGNYFEANKSLKNKGKKKSLEKLLEEAEAKKERLRQLKESDDAEDKEKAKSIVWGDTLKAASGENMKEASASLLKKAIKRKAKKKAKSQEAWKSRMEQTQEKMDERQKIRSHNIKQRAIGGATGANLSKKRIKDDENENGGEEGGKEKKKRPRLGPYSKSRAGFEGKKADFINKGADAKKAKSNQ